MEAEEHYVRVWTEEREIYARHSFGNLIAQLGERGTRVAVVISSGPGNGADGAQVNARWRRRQRIRWYVESAGPQRVSVGRREQLAAAR